MATQKKSPKKSAGAKVVVVLNRKGGVGKSTLTVNLAATTANLLSTRRGAQGKTPVAAVSIDPQGSAVWWAERVDDLPFHIVEAHDDIDGLRNLKNLPGVEQIYVDTPGWIDIEATPTASPLGEGSAAEALGAVLDSADFVVVPVQPEPLSYKPTFQTIRTVVEPLGIPYLVVINNWDPRDGTLDRDETMKFIDNNGWPRANTVIRRYKLHTRASADGQVVTEYPRNRVGLEARLDFADLANEITIAGSR